MYIINNILLQLKAKKVANTDQAFEKVVGVLLYQLATKLKSQIKNRLNFLIENIVKKNLITEAQLTGIYFYF